VLRLELAPLLLLLRAVLRVTTASGRGATNHVAGFALLCFALLRVVLCSVALRGVA
jgi:hypothetical protein